MCIVWLVSPDRPDTPTERDIMLATAAHTLHTDQISDLPHASVNATLRVSMGFERFCQSIIADNDHAARNGLTLIDASVNPDGREGDCSKRIKSYVTSARSGSYSRIMARIRTLAILAGRVSALESADDDMPIIEGAIRESFARMTRIDSNLWHVFVASEKQHIAGPDAAILEIDGGAWSGSAKGHSTTIRYNETADNYLRSHKSSHRYLNNGGASVSERDIARMSD